ncbi:DUF3299 domain-containing protein [Solimonas soli]|uniref:DUF3299 domain-containing protein n=1 Tax=Solimonas soli TaxID=413479 RepID=UPI0004B11E26|nr:DUF3299 domain-containing protein [Solimonas soli]
MPSIRITICMLALAVAACGRPDAPAPDDTATAAANAAPPSAASVPEEDTSTTDSTTPAAANAADESSAPSAKRPMVRYENGKLVEDHSPPVLEITSEFEDRKHGKLAVPAFPGDVVYLWATLQSEAGTPLKGVAVKVESKLGNSHLLMADHTDENGGIEFHLIADRLGEDLITVSGAGIQRDFYLEVTAPTRDQWLSGLDLKGTTSWNLLMSARLDVQRDSVAATFSPPLQALDRKTVRIAGFMLPLGLDEKQTHFLLSANPPSCFFHPPGGPATAMEVFAERGVTMTDAPIVLEGRFELSTKDAGGILYRLKAARLVSTIKS